MRWTTSAFDLAMLSLSGGTPQVVGKPVTSKDSLIVIGTPCSGPSFLPAFTALSAALARLRAPSMSVAMMAFSDGLCVSTRFR